MKNTIRTIACGVCKALGGNVEEEKFTPVILPYKTIAAVSMSSILLDKLEEMGDNKAELYLGDKSCKIYRKEEVKKFLFLNEVDSIPYVAEEMDCDDFAAILYGEFAGLVWTNDHALNWFIDENLKLWFIEPQTDVMSEVLENWDIRFFISR